MSIIFSLKTLVKETGEICRIVAGKESDILSVEYDSRKVKSGSLFVAVKGFESDGHQYIGAAVERGAVAIVVSEDRLDEFAGCVGENVALVASSDCRRALSLLSSVFYGNPSKSMMLVGVTGTNGKTSITYMIESVLNFLNVKTGVIGTVNYRWGGNEIPAPNTTPESRDLQEILYRMKKDDVETVVIEVSSHALELNRAEDIEFDAGIFTNLTRDHLDFHHDFESYYKAKKRLFDLLEKSSKKNKAGIINADDEYGRRLLSESGVYSYQVKGFGFSENSDYMPDEETLENRIDGVSYVMNKPFPGEKIELALSGKFQVYNSLSAMAVIHHMGYGFEEISAGLSDLKNIPGRFDMVSSRLGFSIVVDYAHTADAVLKVLQSAEELQPARLISIIGCGGDRDRTKRPIMGQFAIENSDHVIITSDNPRTEDPGMIIKDILEGVKQDNYEVIQDRREAIKSAVFMAEEGDIVVIAGKGHEDYQIIGKEKIHFDDREIAREYISERENN